jgi:uncharacterized protein (TIGR02996 family)
LAAIAAINLPGIDPHIPQNDLTEVNFLQAIAEGDGTSTRPVYADWLEEHGHDLRAEYVRTQCDLIAAADLQTFDERASHLAILATGLDRRWREQLECPLIQERLAGRRLGWLAFSFSSPRPPGTWELPEQLRYLEKLTPRTPPAPWVMAPRGGWR